MKPETIDYDIDIHFFRQNLKPMWEVSPLICVLSIPSHEQDPENKVGGRFLIRIPPRRSGSVYWENLLLALVGAQFDVPEDEICGVVLPRFLSFSPLYICCCSVIARFFPCGIKLKCFNFGISTLKTPFSADRSSLLCAQF